MKKLLLSLLLLLANWSMAFAQVTNYNRWMSFLDDNAFVCQLSIPGAHDACSSSFSNSLGNTYAKTQSKTVQDMLPLGVRLFDLRPCVDGNKLHINHGIIATSFDFDPIMQQLRDFVVANPTEFCIVLIRHETEGDDNNSNFASLLQTSLSNLGNYLIDFRPNLTVGEARGKILFLSRDDYGTPIRGGRIASWPGNTSGTGGVCYGPETWKCPLWVQDKYEFDNADTKKSAILDMLRQSYQLAGKYNYTWIINGTSGYIPENMIFVGKIATSSAYQNNAKTCNPYMQQLLASGNYNGPVGFVFMDYAADGDNSGYYGLSLTKQVINHNFRYTMSRQGDAIYDSNGNLFIAPKGSDMMWQGKYYRKAGTNASGPSGWYKTDFDDSAWETRHFPTASAGTDAPYYTLWDGTNNFIWVRREFYIDHDPTIDKYKFYVRHDDDCKAYINGILLTSGSGYITNYNTVNIPSSRLRTGRNVLAVQVQQKSGGAYFDCGVLVTEAKSASLRLTSHLWHSFVEFGHNVDFSSTEVRAYKVVDFVDGSLPYVNAEEVTVVPAGEAVIVRSDQGAGTYSIPVTQQTATLSGNMLKVSDTALSVTDDVTIYSIGEQNGEDGFYPVAANATVAKGKAYLDLNATGTTASHIYITIDGDVTGISPLLTSPEEEEQRAATYNLAGQRMSRMQRGVNIVGGKKIIK